jgi:AraC-like DNA-binding protein/HAMP domain-containing protein
MYRPDFFFNHVIRGTEEGEILDWHESVSSRYLAGKFFRALDIQMEEGAALFRVIPFVQSLPMGYNRAPEGYVAYLINEETVSALLSRIDVPEEGWLCVLDSDGKVLTSIHSDPEHISRELPSMEDQAGSSVVRVDGADMLMMYVTSLSSGWKYLAAFPSSFVRDMVHSIRVITWVSYAVLLIFGLVCACFLAYRLSKPIEAVNRMMRDFSGIKADKTLYNHLDQRVGILIRNSRSLQQSLQRKTEFVQSLLFERLLKGRIHDREQLDVMLFQADLNMKAKTYLIMLLYMRVDEDLHGHAFLQEIEAYRILLRDMVFRTFQCTCLVHDLDGETQALLLGFDGEGKFECIDQAEAFTQDFFSALPTRSPVQVDFAGGDPCCELLEIHQSYEQAVEALNGVRNGEGNQMVWYAQMESNGGDYYYPLEMEARLLDALRAGDYRKVELILKRIRRDNYDSRLLSYEAQKGLLYELCGTIHKLRDFKVQPNLAEMVERVDSSADVHHTYDQLCEQFLLICNAIGASRKDRVQELTEAVIRHLDKQYPNPQLSLFGVANKFNLTEAYLSVFFKKHTGTNFSHYVEQLRLRKASQQLLESNIPIKVIALGVGYNSDKAFRRAFKRARSFSPNHYRAKYKMNSQ